MPASPYLFLDGDRARQLDIQHTLPDVNLIRTRLQHPALSRPCGQITPHEIDGEVIRLTRLQCLLTEATKHLLRAARDANVQLGDFSGRDVARVLYVERNSGHGVPERGQTALCERRVGGQVLCVGGITTGDLDAGVSEGCVSQTLSASA